MDYRTLVQFIMRLSAVIQKESGWFIATNPETGTTTQGKTFDEALVNLREATELYLEEFPLSELQDFINQL